MKRMTTDNPQLNIERLLNTARAENNQAVLHIGDEVITLTEYVAKCAKEYGCYVTPESVMDGDSCAECDCPVAILNILGIQAAENNARLKMIEKILGNDYDLDRLKELIEADREGRCVVLPVKEGDRVYCIRERFDTSSGKNYKAISQDMIDFVEPLPKAVGCVGFVYTFSDFGKTIFRDREQAESALKAMKERE